ncbi:MULTISPECIES: TadE/TadG family type IV pilus assembly protein [unclassified Roseovarius]|uniref:TadE/TadG family type IV pilus assembly protein n=1 Tax=unclassified Roseovarius TaxID=2614913 RepID=UPI00273F4843|nr:pilus assembly protein [Roseovarius sp. MMSF_3350]
MARLKVSLRSFIEGTRGSLTVEAVLSLPLLFWSMAATFDFFEIHRYKSVREKGTFTIADMISRETRAAGLTSIYLDNAKILFDEITNDDGVNQIRVSVVSYDADDDEYGIVWSEVRGTGPMVKLTSAQVKDSHETLPDVADGEEIILVESTSSYQPLFNVGLDDVTIGTRVFSAIRFAPQICYEGLCGLQN